MVAKLEENPVIESSGSKLFRPQSIDYKQRLDLGSVTFRGPSTCWYIIGLGVPAFIAIYFLLVFGEYTGRVKVEGAIVPGHGSAEIFSTEKGILVGVNIEKGQRVSKGQILGSVRKYNNGSDGINYYDKANTAYLNRRLEVLSNISILNAKRDSLQISEEKLITKEKSKKALTLQKLDVYEKLLVQQQRIVDSMKALNKENAVSNVELQNHLEKLNETTIKIKSLKLEQIQLDSDKIQEEHAYAKLTIDNSQYLNVLHSQLSEINQQIANNDSLRYSLVTATRNGIILSVYRNEGESISTETPIFLLGFEDESLVAELYLSDRAVSNLSVGDHVNLRYDAFPYTKFGNFKSIVKSIALYPTIDKNGNSLFKVTASLDKQSVSVGDRQISLKAGYKFKADIFTERKSLFRWIFQPIANALSSYTSNQ